MPERISLPKAASASVGAALVLSLSLSGCTNSERDSTKPKGQEHSTTVKGVEEDVPRHVGDILGGGEMQAISYFRINDGMQMGSPNQREALPALSLIKLYIAAYVIDHGEFGDKYDALDMIASSDDETAEKLFKKYPESIDEIAAEYDLESTKAGKAWGYSETSTFDVVSFIAQLKERNPTHPILVAMAHADAVSADGYSQDYGTAKLSKVIGTKWGWSNDKTYHSSVSFGENFIVAAASPGEPEDLSAYVKKEITVDNLNESTARHLDAWAGKEVPTPTTDSSTSSTSATPASSTPKPKSDNKGEEEKETSKDKGRDNSGDKSGEKNKVNGSDKTSEKGKDEPKQNSKGAKTSSSSREPEPSGKE